MGKLKEWEERLEKRSERNKEKIAESTKQIEKAKKGFKNELHNREKPSQQEQFYKNANTTLKTGLVLWALPGIFVVCVLLLFVGFQIWEWLF